MLKELYTAALGMETQQRRLEVLANNMANANTSGFKKESVFEKSLIDANVNLQNIPGSAEQDDSPTGSNVNGSNLNYSTYVNYTKGAFQETGNPLDLAIENENGFFVLQDEDGNQYYTKSGSFKLSNDGTISAMDGKLLLGAEGLLNLSNDSSKDPSSMSDSKAMNLKINANGEIFSNEKLKGNIQIINIDNPETLKKVSNSEFIATDVTISDALPQEEVFVRQGWLENSNVNIIQEMIEMIELQRQFDAGSKVIHANNETLDKTISVGRYY